MIFQSTSNEMFEMPCTSCAMEHCSYLQDFTQIDHKISDIWPNGMVNLTFSKMEILSINFHINIQNETYYLYGNAK